MAGAGDTLLTTPMLSELRAAFPLSEIDALVMQGPSACEVLAGNSAVSRILPHNFMKESLLSSLKFCLKLRKKHYDCVLVPMPHNRLVYNLLALLIGGRERLGFEYSIRCGTLDRIILHRRIQENNSMHLVENNLRIVKDLMGKPMDKEIHRLDLFCKASNEKFADEFIKECGWQDCCVLVGMHPGSGVTKNLELKRWPAEKWAELARAMVEKYNARIFVLGGPEEDSVKEKVISLSGLPGDRIVSLRKGNVLDVASLIRRCNCVVSGDTLIPHLSAAVGTPVAVIYGPTSHVAAYPYGTRYEIVWSGIVCSPCYGFSRHGIRCTNNVFLKCLKDIMVNDVLDAVDEFETMV